MTAMSNTYLKTIDDSVQMTPFVFVDLMKQFRHHRNVRYQFSKKHTMDIMNYRKSQGLKKNENEIPSNMYDVPVTYNTDITCVI